MQTRAGQPFVLRTLACHHHITITDRASYTTLLCCALVANLAAAYRGGYASAQIHEGTAVLLHTGRFSRMEIGTEPVPNHVGNVCVRNYHTVVVSGR